MSVVQSPNVDGLRINMDVLKEIVEKTLVVGGGLRDNTGMMLCRELANRLYLMKVLDSMGRDFYRDVYATSDKGLKSLESLFQNNANARAHVRQLYISCSWVGKGDATFFTSGPCMTEAFDDLAYNTNISRDHYSLIARVVAACATSLETLVLRTRRPVVEAMAPLRFIDFTNVTVLEAPIDIIGSQSAPHYRPIRFPRLRTAKFVIVDGAFWKAKLDHTLDFTDYPSLERVYILITNLCGRRVGFEEEPVVEGRYIQNIRVAASTKYVAVELETGDLPTHFVGSPIGVWWIHPKLTFIVLDRYLTVQERGCTWRNLDDFTEQRWQGMSGKPMLSNGEKDSLVVFCSKP
ncbi:hypothetical protein V5O48_007517 [Marasmius crinis-equi]|uniref:Uncharacterized protein n=1 Tax=Marasmius crinis-equi TaxID=585013 RepID=A0ABR3FGE4_9AGAR